MVHCGLFLLTPDIPTCNFPYLKNPDPRSIPSQFPISLFFFILKFFNVYLSFLFPSPDIFFLVLTPNKPRSLLLTGITLVKVTVYPMILSQFSIFILLSQECWESSHLPVETLSSFGPENNTLFWFSSYFIGCPFSVSLTKIFCS